ncbi:MAG TPA: hypothetical protein VJ201_04500, partial [Candidatus Babeliales bacterium]|nr:hypothetical protein [Candidatus Babeliales bacterium]
MQKLSLGFKLLSFVLLVSVGDAQGMEVIEIIPSLCKPLSSIFSSLSSLLPSSYTNQKSEKLNTQRLKANKNDFEQALDSLKNDSWAEKAHLSVLSTLRNQDYDLTYFKANAHVILVNATRNPINFLFYCYYQKYHNDWDRTDIDFLVEPKHEDLFNS